MGAATKADDDLESTLATAREDLSKCIMSNSWKITLASMAPALGYGVWKKTYTPLIAVSAFGSGADYLRALTVCEDLQDRVKELENKQAVVLQEKQ